MNIEEILDQVPNYKEFLTVSELNDSTKCIIENFDFITTFEIGKSREGRSINCIKMGNGKKKALFIGFPHPNEPIGSLTIEFLSSFLAENPTLIKKLGFTFYFIKAIDIDGAILNEGWFKGEFTPLRYAKNFYRPPLHEQIEWSFPINYKKLNFSTPTPEARALMRLFQQIKPSFIYCLHNAEFCGVYYYVSKYIKEMNFKFLELVKKMELPLHKGEPELPFFKKIRPGIYQAPSITAGYDFYEGMGIEDPSSLSNVGGSSYDYLRTNLDNDFFLLICEMPYIYNKDLGNRRKTELNRRDLIIDFLNYSKELFDNVILNFDPIQPYCNRKSRIYASVSTLIKEFQMRHKIELNAAKNSPIYDGKATIAEVFDMHISRKFNILTRCSQLTRLFEECSEIHPEGSQKLKKCQQDYKIWIENKIEEIFCKVDYQIIPIQKLVKIQVGSALIALDYLKNC